VFDHYPHRNDIMNVHTLHRSFVAALACAALAACGGDSPTEAPAHVGTYVLQTAAGQPAPALIESIPDPESGQSIEVRVLSDTLELHADGTYRQRAQLEARLGGALLGRSIWSDHGDFTVTNGALHFDSNYLQNVAFDGAFTSGVVTLTQNLVLEGTDDVYVLTR
jgi:hypothetical protein